MIERTVCVVLSDGCVPLSSQIRDTENKRAMGLGNPNNASGHDFVRSKRYTQAAVRPSSARPMLSCSRQCHEEVSVWELACPPYRY